MLYEMRSKVNSSQASLQWMQSLFKGDSLKQTMENVHEATILNVISDIFERNTSQPVFALKDELVELKKLAENMDDLMVHLTANHFRDPMRVCPHGGILDFNMVLYTAVMFLCLFIIFLD